MSLEYSDDNELIYQAKAVAKDIVNAKYEVTQKVGNFLFLAHSEEEFYQRATAVDQILESTSTRRLASVSDSKAKLVKALFQEWEIKHASCEGCDPANFSLPARVAMPVLPEAKKSRKLWNNWSILRKKKDGSGDVERNFPLEGKNPKNDKPYDAFDKNRIKLSLLDQAIGGSIGRLDNPEVRKQVVPGSTVWVDPYGLYGSDKKRKANSLKGRKPQESDTIDPSQIVSMVGTVLGRPSLGSEGVFHTYHKDAGNTFRGFNASDNSFTPCQHEHHEGDGCGLTSSVAGEGSMQPGCGQQHILTKVQSHSFVSIPSEDGTNRIGAIPHIEDEKPEDLSKLTPSAKQQRINRTNSSESSAEDYTNPTEEQVGEIPPYRMFLMHPDQAARWASGLDKDHADAGGTGRHPANLETFKIGDKTHRVGDIVSTVRKWGSSEPRTEANLGILVGASSHRNGQHVRFGRSEGLAPNTEGDSSMASATPGEYSLMIHRLDSPTTGKTKHPLTAVDPNTNSILPNSVNETTQYYPSSDVETVARPDAKKVNTTSKLYSALKSTQATFKAKPESVRIEKPKTVKPSRNQIDTTSIDLNDLFK